MPMSFETALSIAAEIAGDMPEDGLSRRQFLRGLDWQEYEQALEVLINSKIEMPGPMVIFLPGECGIPLSGSHYQHIKRRSMGLCDCGNVRLLPGCTLDVPANSPIFVRRRRRNGTGIGLLRFAVDDGVVQVLAYPFDATRLTKVTVPMDHLLECEARMIGINAPGPAILTIKHFDPQSGTTTIEMNAVYEIFEPPYDPEEVPERKLLN